MKATFAAREPNILLEAGVGDLFTPMGTRLVECVCAVRSIEALRGGVRVDVAPAAELDPNAVRPVVVLACRIGKGEPEYFAPGFQTYLSAATPISFLEQVEPLALRERAPRSDDAQFWNFEITMPSPRDRAAANACVDAICTAVNATFDATDMPISRL